MLLESLRHQLYLLHAELPRNNLVTWTSGNISGRDPETGWVAIKQAGDVPDLTPRAWLFST